MDEKGADDLPSRHRYIVSGKLRSRLESLRFRGRWSSTRGIAEENAKIVGTQGNNKKSKITGTNSEQQSPIGCDIPVTEIVFAGGETAGDRGDDHTPYFDETRVCVANVDTIGAALGLLAEPNVRRVCVLNFANHAVPGGRYTHGGMAQEEDLCRLMPQLHPSLAASGMYPIPTNAALLTRDVPVLRETGTYKLRQAPFPVVSVVSAAMPCGVGDRRPPGGWDGSAWEADVKLRIGAVLAACAAARADAVVLGAFGCGAFGNPARPVARAFASVLREGCGTRGRFSHVAFAVLDPLGTGNLRPFREELGTGDIWR